MQKTTIALLTAAMLVTGLATALTTTTTTTTAYAQPSKPNHIRWCIDVTLVDISSGDIVTQQSCGETKKDCQDGREAALGQPTPPISVSECYLQNLKKL
jgi:hypothetical protein